MIGVRYRPDTGFEGQCDYCRDWWPLTLDSWTPGGMRRCRACMAEYKRQHEAGRRGDAAIKALHNTRNRERYYRDRPKHLAAAQRWRDKNRDRIAAYNKAYRARDPEATRLAVRAYYREAREVILLKKKLAYRVKKAAA